MKKIGLCLMVFSMLIFSMTACSKEEVDDVKSETLTTEAESTNSDMGNEAEDLLSGEAGDIEYMYRELEDGTACIYSYSCDNPPEVLEIPSKIDGKTVTMIESLFSTEEIIKKVIIPETVTVIGKDSFHLAESIEEVEIKGVIETIGEQAFMQCLKLKSLTFKEGLKVMEPYGVYVCPNLTEAHMPGSVEEISGQSNLTGCENLTIYAPAGSIFEELANEVGINFQAE